MLFLLVATLTLASAERTQKKNKRPSSKRRGGGARDRRRTDYHATCEPKCDDGHICECPAGRRLFGAPPSDDNCYCVFVGSPSPPPPPSPPPSPSPPPKPPPSPPPLAPIPTVGTVRNLGGAAVTDGLVFYPEVWWEGNDISDPDRSPGWYPICGHYFWDSNDGPAIACRRLKGGTGCTGGINTCKWNTCPAPGTYDTDAVHIGECGGSDTELYSCTTSANRWNDFDMYGGQCNAGSQWATIQIQCNAGCTAPADV